MGKVRRAAATDAPRGDGRSGLRYTKRVITNFDTATLALITSLVFATQTVAVFVQYRVNRTYRGLDWWFLGAVSQALGFFLMLTLKVQSIWMLAILANPLVVCGQVFQYVGVARFLDRKESRWGAGLLFALFLTLYLFFVFVRHDVLARSVIVSSFSAVIAIASAYALFRGKRSSFLSSANFTAAVFLAYACAQTAITVATLNLPPISSRDDFYQLPVRSIAFLVPIVGGMLWTFAFILMVNQRLYGENIEEKEKLKLVFNLSPDAKLITRMGDGLIVDVNAGFLMMTGYTRDEIVGKPQRYASIWNTEEDLQNFQGELEREGGVENKEFVFHRKDGGRFIGLISGSIIAIQDVPHIVSVIHDMTARKQVEQEVQELLAEKELILKEVHHRIKNNMSTIHSLLALQARALKDPASVSALEDTRSRIRSMMVLYDTLYTSVDFIDLSVKAYLPPLISEIVSNFPNAGSVKVETHIDEFVLEIKKLQPLGMILNELLTNSMKYAFNDREGELKVSVSLADGQVTLMVQDNGPGLPPSVDFENSTGFGLTLVNALTQQLGGTIRLEHGDGMKIVLVFEK